MRILIADDSPSLCSTLERLAATGGHDCHVATNGSEARAMLEGESGFDLVISEWELPILDGLDLCRFVRDADQGPHYTTFMLLATAEKRGDLLGALRSGVDDYLLKPFHADDFRARLFAAERLRDIRRTLGDQSIELSALNAEIAADSRTDRLTHLPNSRRLQEDLMAMNARVARYGHRYSLGLLDVDLLAQFNDHRGRDAGDQLLKTVASTIAAQCRSGDVAYRYGGEEFVVLMPEQPAEKAAIGVERIRRAVHSLGLPHQHSPHKVVTLSAGVAGAIPGGSGPVEAPIGEADEALYWAKENGRNRTQIYAEGGEILAA
ncbi:MAG: diguanylate cyclase [Chloroflexi bacterium]|nr:diguanylate cyclase [Chloroflexota bacterium]